MGRTSFFLYWWGIPGYCQYYSGSLLKTTKHYCPLPSLLIYCLTVDTTTHNASIRIMSDQISAHSVVWIILFKNFFSLLRDLLPGQKLSALSFLDVPGLAMVSHLEEISGFWCMAESSLEPFALLSRLYLQNRIDSCIISKIQI